jgi:hypothetical protein
VLDQRVIHHEQVRKFREGLRHGAPLSCNFCGRPLLRVAAFAAQITDAGPAVQAE